MEIALSKEDKPEILRYLEYRKHDIDENLDRQLDRCMDLINKAARPKYISKVVDISNGIPKDCTFIKGFDILIILKILEFSYDLPYDKTSREHYYYYIL